MKVRYPVTIQVISGSSVVTSEISNSGELLQLILDLQADEAINIVLTANHKADYSQPVIEPPEKVQHLHFEVDIGLSAVPCIYVRRSV